MTTTQAPPPPRPTPQVRSKPIVMRPRPIVRGLGGDVMNQRAGHYLEDDE